MKSLILYYSRTGKTRFIANEIAKNLKIKAVDIKDLKNRAGFFGYLIAGRDALFGRLTEITPKTINLNAYDTLFIGTPVWGSRPAPAIKSLIEYNDFKNKKIILFATYGGSGYEKTITRTAELVAKKGGKVVGSFSIKSGGTSDEFMVAKTKEALKMSEFH